MTEAKQPASITAHCIVCGLEKSIQFSLRLERVDGTWKTNPVCGQCKATLVREAKAEGRFIPFFGIEASQKEAAKRNTETQAHRRLVEKYGRKRDDRATALKSNLITLAAHR